KWCSLHRELPSKRKAWQGCLFLPRWIKVCSNSSEKLGVYLRTLIRPVVKKIGCLLQPLFRDWDTWSLKKLKFRVSLLAGEYLKQSESIRDWVHDQKQGYGEYLYANGDTYTGEWANNKRHGQGTYVYKDTGSKYVGCWVNGIQDGPAELIHLNHRFKGRFLSGKPLGHGKFIFDIGCEQRGEYKQPVQDKEEEEEEEEQPLPLEPIWKASEITKLTPWSPQDEELLGPRETAEAAVTEEDGGHPASTTGEGDEERGEEEVNQSQEDEETTDLGG
uniref:Radial spoke head 1 homolog n=1 Tax=Ficedula albicollis TaxID=59894 RepID=A0A803W5E4_FICAL